MTKEEYNRKRRERYKKDEAYREKCKARNREYNQTEHGKERNRKKQRKFYNRHRDDKYGIIDDDRYFY